MHSETPLTVLQGVRILGYPAREEIARNVEPVIWTRTTHEWVEYLVPRGIWAPPVLDHEAVLGSPAVREADVVEEVEHPTAGRVRPLRFPVECSSGRASCRRIPPGSGEPTDEVLRETGYSETEVQRFREGGVV